MPQADIPFPKSSNPGQHPGEGQGRLLNAFCEMDGGLPTWRPVPGLKLFAGITDEFDSNAPVLNTRGMIVRDNVLHVLQGGTIFTLTTGAYLSRLAGDVAGIKPVTMALNNRSPDRDLCIVTEVGAFLADGQDVVDYGDPNLPSVNSVSSLDGYFLFTTGDGKIYASGLNDPTIDPLSFTSAEANPDGLMRGTVNANQFFAWGSTSVEVYQDVGATPFPLQRVTVIPIGLLSPSCIAGWEEGWSNDQIFVANDGTVRRLQGYQPIVVSNKDVERAIGAVADKTNLRAFVYIFEGHPIWSLSCPSWTWCYNLATGFWHERKTYGMQRWFCEESAYFNGQWILSRYDNENLLILDAASFNEDGLPIAMTIESAPVKDFPQRVNIPAAFFDWTTGNAPLTGPFDVSDPEISISWSKDGGGIWGNEVIASSLGKTGQYVDLVRVNRIGLSSGHGLRFRLMTTSPVYKTFRGGKVEFQAKGP